MSYADKVFIDMCRDIIDNGTDTRGEKVRPVWEDGTPAYTIKKFGVVNRYDLSKEFPALTLRRNLTTSMICTVISGIVGQMKMVRSVKPMVISWGSNISTKKECLTR